MSTSTLDLAPRENSARGAGSNADAWTPPPADYTAAGQALTRATQPGYFDWLDHVRAAAGCTRPVRLTGTLDTIEATTGRLLDSRHTDQLPDAAIYKACGNRRSTVCPACARTYQRDAFQILRAGLIGGKGVPTTVARHPAVFVTLTAPSFGAVHTRHVRKHTCTNRARCSCRPEPCHARRNPGLCQHYQPAVCWARHEPGDPQLGRPLCLDCYDHQHHVVWNLFSGELWHRTKQDAERRLAKLCKARGIPFHEVSNGKNLRRIPPVRLAHGKAAEMQRRGAVHFHALIRLDGIDPTDPTRVVAPPPGIGLNDLVDALTAASDIDFTTPDHPDRPDGWPMAWGEQIDIRPISLTGTGEVTDSMVAGYLAKYATKSTEITGHNSTRITGDTITQHADPAGDHIARLIHACWHLGNDPDAPAGKTAIRLPVYTGTAGAKIRQPFGAPRHCPDCGTRTRYRTCPVCVAERQASLDTQRPNDRQPTPYARLRRWAHMLGFGGHFLTKARRYSVTFRLLRETRIDFRRAEPDPADNATVHTVDHLDETTLIVGTLTFAGVGWHTTGDALLANTAAAQARERQAIGREELAHEASTSRPVALNAA
ncbi:plasmid replication initiator protein [Actinoplanes sp. SE50]|uniref:replication initiator n=1 Tax=unclassified Actinoplanes TaxID=2626549 RepID=UPI00023ECD75|nr:MULTISPECIES: replication initiator [unclassified Actinoplanes]AEV87190.1 Replication initiator protein [Actinoplanes sp. SE50/110]ATO85591.1 plasmid replication initiator protein [Actinoplanes sp. SE50]SLM03004.1 plasmid replication initiator protein [Actinoplanes sp. SE50/110]